MSPPDLRGLRVLNTRPQRQGEALNRLILAAQGDVIHFPTLSIQATALDWLATLRRQTRIDQAIFTSANAVWHAAQALPLAGNPSIIAIGKATAQALQDQGVSVASCPSVADSEHLLQLPELQTLQGKTVLLFKGEGGRTLIATVLRQRGARLVELNVYRRQPVTVDEKQLDRWWQDDAVDIILMTSHEAMNQLFTMVGDRDIRRLQQIPCLVISPRLADIATRMGMKTVITSPVDALMESLQQFNKGLHHGY